MSSPHDSVKVPTESECDERCHDCPECYRIGRERCDRICGCGWWQE